MIVCVGDEVVQRYAEQGRERIGGDERLAFRC